MAKLHYKDFLKLETHSWNQKTSHQNSTVNTAVTGRLAVTTPPSCCGFLRLVIASKRQTGLCIMSPTPFVTASPLHFHGCQKKGARPWFSNVNPQLSGGGR